jgi:hypothetical protein
VRTRHNVGTPVPQCGLSVLYCVLEHAMPHRVEYPVLPVLLQIHPLKGIFLSHHPVFTAQYQIFRTCHPLNPVLHTNYPPRGPFVIVFFISPPSPPLQLILSPPLGDGESAWCPHPLPQAAATAPAQELRWQTSAPAIPASAAVPGLDGAGHPFPREDVLLPAPSPSPTAVHWRSRGRRPCLHHAAPRPDLASSLPPSALPPATSPAGEKDIEPGHPLLLYGGWRRDGRPSRGSGAASSLLCGGSGGAREEQGRR